MYKIIGADGKAYGPVSTEQIRQWIAESRVNGQTQVQAEGTQEWKPLAMFPEFAQSFGGPEAPIAPSLPAVQMAANRDAALKAVRAPAIALKITAILGLVAVAIGLVANVLSLLGVQFMVPASGDENFGRLLSGLGGALGILQGVVGAIVGVLILNGASKMQNLKSYQFAFATAILAMVPCVSPCCLLGLPFGIWALVVLNQSHVKSHFS
jgi:hypothetical protein